jgi:hypothetical protein
MFSTRTISAAVVFATFGQAALATTGTTVNSEESFALHPPARSQSSGLTRAQVLSDLGAARQVNAATNIWTAPDGGNPARLAGGNAVASMTKTAMGAAPALNQPPATARPAHTVYVGNVD